MLLADYVIDSESCSEYLNTDLCIFFEALLSSLTYSRKSQYDSPCGSAKSCISLCPNSDFFPMIDSCDTASDGTPDCYVNFYCA
ncbi:hypothetical protein RU639_006560 [Aspergillus parasiticus]